MNATVFLISTIFNLYLMVVLLRFWLQLSKADFYNPMSQFVVKHGGIIHMKLTIKQLEQGKD